MRGVPEEQVSATAKQVAVGSREIAGLVENFARSAATQADMVDQIADASQKIRTEVHQNLDAAAET